MGRLYLPGTTNPFSFLLKIGQGFINKIAINNDFY